MGYDIHITRKESWSAREGPQIGLAERQRQVATGPDLECDASNGEHDFVFVAHPLEPVPLWWSEGEICTKSPDQQTVRKLIAIAEKLGARVVGDDDEAYTDWTIYPQPSPPALPSKKGFLRRLFGK